MLASIAAHALAAVTIGGILYSLPQRDGHDSVSIEVDVAPRPVRTPELISIEAPPAPSNMVARSAKPARRRPDSVVPRSASTTTSTASPEPTVVPQPDDGTPAPARFVISAGTVATTAHVVTPGNPSKETGGAGTDPTEEIASERAVDVPARLLSASPLVYPPAARNAGIELDYAVEIVVDTLGRVASARSLTRVGYGLDEAALRAIAEYRFAPAQRGGRPVRVRMRWIVQFRLR